MFGNLSARVRHIVVAAGGSAALLLGAFGFQLAGYAPCAMCIWQRWPHAAAVAIGAVALALPSRLLLWLGAAAAFATGAIGVFHAGVEQKWWPGPASCTGSGSALSGLSGADLLDPSKAGRIVMCDQISWQFLGLSMPAWNAVLSFVLVAVWVRAALRKG